jgi:hypothetical protein
MNLSVIFLLKNLFLQGHQTRTISLNQRCVLGAGFLVFQVLIQGKGRSFT